MSLLNISFVPFPSPHSSPSASSSRVSTSYPNRTRRWCNSQSAPARRSEPGHRLRVHAGQLLQRRADREPRQSPRLLVPRRRHHDHHQSRRPTDFSNIKQQPEAAQTFCERASGKTPASPLAGVGCLAEWLTQLQTQVMSPTPPTFSYMDTAHTPIHLTDSHNDFQCQDDATVISTTDPEGLPNYEASSSSQKATVSRVSSLFGHSSLGKLSGGHVSGRPGGQETGAELDRESVSTTLLRSQSKGKRDRDTNVVHSLRGRENLQEHP